MVRQKAGPLRGKGCSVRTGPAMQCERGNSEQNRPKKGKNEESLKKGGLRGEKG